MKNGFLRLAIVFTILFGIMAFTFTDLIILSFQDPIDMYAEDFDIIENGKGGHIEAEIYWSLGAFGYETTTTTKNGRTTSSSTDYYYTIPAFDKDGETYYIALKVSESKRSLLERITDDTWGYLEGTITEWTDNTYDFEGTIKKLDNESYGYLVEFFEELEVYDDDADLKAHVLPLCLETYDYDSAPMFMTVTLILLALAILFWVLFFRKFRKKSVKGDAVATDNMTTDTAPDGIPTYNVPQPNADPYNTQYSSEQYNNTQYNNEQYYNPQYDNSQFNNQYDNNQFNNGQ